MVGARFIVINHGGYARLDFGLGLGPNGDRKISVGSIEGDGNIYVGADQITVGSNNLSTNFSGNLTDDDGYTGSGGSFVK